MVDGPVGPCRAQRRRGAEHGCGDFWRAPAMIPPANRLLCGALRWTVLLIAVSN
ncbi:hypothetical protein Z947_1462 [Sulfitobacter geojensis]|nr:hypothetical protein Z947_1462 [Sulfitobacter geojensis]